MFFLSRINLATFFGFPFIPSCFYTGYCFLKGVNRFTRSLKLFRISRLFHYLVIKVPLPVFSLGIFAVLRSSFYILPHRFRFVNNFFKNLFFKTCWLVQASSLCILPVFDSFDSIPCFLYPVKNFFQVFPFFSSAVNPEKRTEKEGFEPSRRY